MRRAHEFTKKNNFFIRNAMKIPKTDKLRADRNNHRNFIATWRKFVSIHPFYDDSNKMVSLRINDKEVSSLPLSSVDWDVSFIVHSVYVHESQRKNPNSVWTCKSHFDYDFYFVVRRSPHCLQFHSKFQQHLLRCQNIYSDFTSQRALAHIKTTKKTVGVSLCLYSLYCDWIAFVMFVCLSHKRHAAHRINAS